MRNDTHAAWADDLRDEASELQPGARRDATLKKLLRSDTAANIDNWENSPATQPSDESMDFVERCFVAITVAGLAGLTAVVAWM